VTRIIALQQALHHPSFAKSAIAFIRCGDMKAAETDTCRAKIAIEGPETSGIDLKKINRSGGRNDVSMDAGTHGR
jgi:hypothetical protein